MKTFFTSFVLSLLALPTLFGQTEIEFDATANWIAFMNVTDLPADGGGFQFGSPWGLPDVKSTLDVGANTITLQPNFNTYAANPGDPFWVNQSTGAGNKQMEANTFVEPGINDVDLTFSGTVDANTLADGYTAQFFIKALDSLASFSDALNGMKIMALPASGDFSVSVTASEIPTGLLVQYGFTITGPNANPADEATLGSVVVSGELTTGEPNDVLFSAEDNWIAFMNVSDLPADGGAYQFGSTWALPDVKSTPDVGNNTLTLQPNFNTYAVNSTDPFWVNQSTGAGNKQMEALTFVEPGPTFNGSDLTFRGFVQSYTLADGYSAQFFIKALDSLASFGDALQGMKTFDIPSSGEFTVSVTAAEIPVGLIVQYGFIIAGPNANPDDEAALGSVVIGAEPVSTSNLVELAATYYPNPAQDFVILQAEDIIETVSIFNQNGQQVLTINSGQQQERIDISQLPAGNYVLLAEIGGQQGVAKLIKQ